ncbi:MAG: prepilin-type N-terminal cleavage/methylation domain-containing protein [Patescibacteria group bacterium]|jgi:prepilin-type N-terminal cleavage/methylation domain-containing protein
MFKKKNNKTKEPAFTLVELLVVIAIIGILATLAIVSLQNARARARDAKRIADIKQIQTALELYFNDNGAYPASTSVTSSIRSISRVYMERYPQAPNPPDGDCTEENNEYVYTEAGEDNGSYVLTFCLGGSVASLLAGTKEASPIGISESLQCGEAGYNVSFIYNGGSVTYGTVLNTTTGECWLDRNLGATRVAQSSSDSDAYGHLFQWGRGDDGHQVRTSNSTTTLSSSDNPSHGDFIIASDSPYDWRSGQNDNLWQGVNGINNPCPSGWRIPTEGELDAERESWSSNYPAGAFASPLKLPVAGIRVYNSGDFAHANSNGLYWASNVSGTESYYLSFEAGGAYTNDSYRAWGMSIRCIKD